MSSKKPRKPTRLPAIVPRFLKNAVAIGAIPALVGCDKGQPPRAQPVVANDQQPAVVAAYGADAPTAIEAPVVAAMLPAVVAAMVNPPPPPLRRDAGADAATKKSPKPRPTPVKPPPPPVVAALVIPRDPPPDLNDRPPPPVVAAMVPEHDPLTTPMPKKKR